MKDKEKAIEKDLKSQFKAEVKEHKAKAITYFVLRFLVIVVMIAQIFNKNWDNVFMCVLTLVLFLIPTVLEKRLNIELPNTLEIIVLLFIYSAEILGEIQEYYLIFDKWDDMLHTINGFLCAAIGFAMIDILNRSDKFHISLSPLFVAMVSFCFSMTIGVLWEFFEFFMDFFTHSDMQKDTVLATIYSVMFNPEGVNTAVGIDVKSMVVNGQLWNYGGYIDIGLY
ncbi:MAG: hypothetical protein RRY25_08870, partial [Anaerovorax sp.]